MVVYDVINFRFPYVFWSTFLLLTVEDISMKFWETTENIIYQRTSVWSIEVCILQYKVVFIHFSSDSNGFCHLFQRL